MKHLSILITAFLLNSVVFAQNPDLQPDVETGGKLVIRTNSIYGKLVEKKTNKPVEAASVQLYMIYPSGKDTLIDAMLSKNNGEFKFENLPAADSFRLYITALGFEPEDDMVRLGENVMMGFNKDIGNVSLMEKIKQLERVIITSTQPALQMGIDRKVFNVDKSLVATGGTAVDIMKNIPSVSVDIDGNVELRNSSPQIFVDGRPTILTLDQIPADQIDKIELITNPSAKFDAASSGGIINVVLKKNKRVGLNGLATLSGGTPKQFSSNLNLNLRQGKFNFFATGGHNLSGGRAKGRTLRQNKNANVITDYFNQYSLNERSRRFNSVRFGADFFADNRNTIGISQSFFSGKFGNEETQDQEFLNAAEQLQYTGDRNTASDTRFKRRSTGVNFKHNFPTDGKELTADITYNYGTRDNNTEIDNAFFNPDGTMYRPTSLVFNEGSSNEKQWNIQADYMHPLSETTKFETGVRFNNTEFVSFYDAFTRNNGQDIRLPLSNNYAYTEMVNAAYFTYSYKKETFSYQLGLRTEYSKFDGELVDSAYKFGYEYPNKLRNIWDALFPSLFVTKKIGEKDEVQFNYSRRIRRPRFWQLNPFIDINDPVNLQQGNPQLQPEYINSYELNYSKNYKKGNLLTVLYFRNNPRDITRYSDTITTAQFQQLNNAAIDQNAILNTFINASTTNRYGLEVTLQHKVGNKFDITPTFNLQYRTVNAKVNNLDLSNRGLNYEAKLISNYKIEANKSKAFNNMSFQLIADYESPRVYPQGKSISEFTLDLAAKKEFGKKKKASLSLSVNDVFNTGRWGTIYDTDRFYQNSFRRWNVRNIRLAFTYKFGDSNFSLLRRGNRGGGDEDS